MKIYFVKILSAIVFVCFLSTSQAFAQISITNSTEISITATGEDLDFNKIKTQNKRTQ